MNSGIDLFNRLYMGDRGIQQILIDLVDQQVVVQVDDIDILPDEQMEWRPGLDFPAICNAQLVFVGCNLVTICPQDSALDGLILNWGVEPIEREHPWPSAKYRFEFLIVGGPTAVTLRIEADDFQLVSGEGDSAEIPFENRD